MRNNEETTLNKQEKFTRLNAVSASIDDQSGQTTVPLVRRNRCGRDRKVVVVEGGRGRRGQPLLLLLHFRVLLRKKSVKNR